MSRWKYFFKRVLLSIPVLFLALTFIFVLLRMGPVDPVAARLGPEATGAEAEQMRERLGLNDPLWEQYIDFTTSYLTFDFGQSWVVYSGYEVTAILSWTAPPTLWLGFWAILLPLFIGIPLGFYAGLRPNTGGDYVASVAGILWQAMPNFWLCIMLLAVLRQTQGNEWFDWYAVGYDSVTGTPNLGFFNVSAIDVGLTSIPFVTGIDWGILGADIKLILPAALVLGSASMAAEMRIGRTAILETINSNYVVTAKAKGLKDRVIIWKHVFRNAMIPLVPVITNEAFLLIGGSVVVEQIFNINGIGRTFFRAMIDADLPLAGALLFIFTVIIILLNIFQDLLYTIIDPRVGYDK
ncbi:ABC transporter permease [Natronorubrum tibetense]|uniref:ABC transporter integral membrane protein n=1 Tax=Natronorubrum tibetense GA33 TaxID=1114856 RepID=L9W3W3_9EURY|nr:ABC transporter permease [Natronorubrum tibetense]ELY43023.1 ABC transporter integral membrane protein [Natronorubrum tibetense GA33]